MPPPYRDDQLKPSSVPGLSRILTSDSREYYNTQTGEVISKRQYNKIRRGGLSNETYKQQRRKAGVPNKMRGYTKLVDQLSRRTGRSKGAIRRDKETRRVWQEFKQAGVSKERTRNVRDVLKEMGFSNQEIDGLFGGDFS